MFLCKLLPAINTSLEKFLALNALANPNSWVFRLDLTARNQELLHHRY